MTQNQPLIVITHPDCLYHDTGGGLHPEVPARLTMVLDRLRSGPLAPQLSEMQTIPANRKWLEKVHDQNYLMRFEEAALLGRSHLDHQDNQICYDSFRAAMLAAGAGLLGIDLIERQEARHVFCCIRPPGHHAEQAKSLGFCFVNNVAVAAAYWREIHNGRKILIIDWDAHHGNGIQNAFWHDPDIFYVSVHEHPTYSFPGTGFAEENGIGAGAGTTLNIPLLPGAGDEAILQAFETEILPAIERFQPDALIVAAGFDGHQLDDMSGLLYSTGLYGRLGEIMADLGRKYCRDQVLTILEGGYHLEALAASVEAYLQGLAKLG